jgi:hypothetical protein
MGRFGSNTPDNAKPLEPLKATESSRVASEPLNPDQAYSEALAKLSSAADKWRAAAGTQIAKDAAAAHAAASDAAPARGGDMYDDLETLSWARLALGSGWEPPKEIGVTKGDLAFSRLTNAWKNLTVGGQARVGLVLAREKKDAGGG